MKDDITDLHLLRERLRAVEAERDALREAIQTYVGAYRDRYTNHGGFRGQCIRANAPLKDEVAALNHAEARARP